MPTTLPESDSAKVIPGRKLNKHCTFMKRTDINSEERTFLELITNLTQYETAKREQRSNQDGRLRAIYTRGVGRLWSTPLR